MAAAEKVSTMTPRGLERALSPDSEHIHNYQGGFQDGSLAPFLDAAALRKSFHGAPGHQTPLRLSLQVPACLRPPAPLDHLFTSEKCGRVVDNAVRPVELKRNNFCRCTAKHVMRIALGRTSRIGSIDYQPWRSIPPQWHASKRYERIYRPAEPLSHLSCSSYSGPA